MNLAQKKRIEVYADTKCVVLKDDLNEKVVIISNSGNTLEFKKETNNIGSTFSFILDAFHKKTYLINAVYGLVKLQTQSYLICVTKADFAANIAGRNTYLASEFEFIPLGFLDPIQDSVSIGMFKRYFDLKCFYFSAEYDLTNPISNLAEREFKTEPHDDRFSYNSVHYHKFVELGALNWVQPFICGLIEHKLFTINQKTMSFTLISRRDKSRAGMRLLSRGADNRGNVSNFVETEQITCFINDDSYDVCSYLQTRGSIPFLWKQQPNLKWNPTLTIEANGIKNKTAAENHFKRMQKHYTETHLVNLIDKKGSQKKIGEYFTEMHRELKEPGIKYTWFDFHDECKKMQWHNLSKLISQLKDSLEKYSYGQFKVFKTVDEGVPPKVSIQNTQRGVFRTNCMDCLDRTNVVQSVLARNILLSQLYKHNIVQKPNGDPFEHLPRELDDTFREFWTNNANRVSLLYSGTGAMKVDFTRHGKRSHMGAIDDGKKAITRYFINNFYDTYNQNSLDLLLGKIRADELPQQEDITATKALAVTSGLLIGPYYLSAILLAMFGKTFNWSYFIIMIALSSYMAYSYAAVATKKIWETQVLKDV